MQSMLHLTILNPTPYSVWRKENIPKDTDWSMARLKTEIVSYFSGNWWSKPCLKLKNSLQNALSTVGWAGKTKRTWRNISLTMGRASTFFMNIYHWQLGIFSLCSGKQLLVEFSSTVFLSDAMSIMVSLRNKEKLSKQLLFPTMQQMCRRRRTSSHIQMCP